MTSDDIGMGAAQDAAWDAAAAHERTIDAADELRARVTELEAERDDLKRKLAETTAFMDRSTTLALEAATALLSTSRRTDQLHALLRSWDRREAMFATTTDADLAGHGLLGGKPTAQHSAAAATLMCSSDLRNVLRCKNPDCPSCAPAKAKPEQPATEGNEDAQPRP